MSRDRSRELSRHRGHWVLASGVWSVGAPTVVAAWLVIPVHAAAFAPPPSHVGAATAVDEGRPEHSATTTPLDATPGTPEPPPRDVTQVAVSSTDKQLARPGFGDVTLLASDDPQIEVVVRGDPIVFSGPVDELRAYRVPCSPTAAAADATKRQLWLACGRDLLKLSDYERAHPTMVAERAPGTIAGLSERDGTLWAEIVMRVDVPVDELTVHTQLWSSEARTTERGGRPSSRRV